MVGDGGGWWSFLHLEGAASSTALAIETGDPGVYNIVDDEPAPVREWLPALAAILGAKPPRRIPAWVARIAVSEHGRDDGVRDVATRGRQAVEGAAVTP
jgi:2-alkyl-3-oxoalkanoate reductase